MWHSGPWFNGGPVNIGLMVGPDELKDLFQPKQFMILWFLVLVLQDTDSQTAKYFRCYETFLLATAKEMPCCCLHPLTHSQALSTQRSGGWEWWGLAGWQSRSQQYPLLFGPHKLRVSTPHSLLANVTGTFRLWGVSRAADEPPHITGALLKLQHWSSWG